MRKAVKSVELLRKVEGAVESSIQTLMDVVTNKQAKLSEVINSADKIIKLRFALQDSIQKEALAKIELEYKQLNLEEKRIKLEALRGIASPDSTPDQKKEYSRVFEPTAILQDADYGYEDVPEDVVVAKEA